MFAVSSTLLGRERNVEKLPQDLQEWGYWERGGWARPPLPGEQGR